MINYSSSATALLAITSIIATVNADRPKKTLRKESQQRELYDLPSNHFITDTDTVCRNVIEGNPEICVISCTETTSTWTGDTLIDERTKTTQRKCEAGWEGNGHISQHSWKGDTEWPTYSPSTHYPTYFPSKWDGDDHMETSWSGDDYETDSPTPVTTETSWSGDEYETDSPTPFPTSWGGDDHSMRDSSSSSSDLCDSELSKWSESSWSEESKASLTSIDNWSSASGSSGSWSVSGNGGKSSGGKTGKSGGGGKGGKSGGGSSPSSSVPLSGSGSSGGEGKTGKSGGAKGGKSGGGARRLNEKNNDGRKLFWPFTRSAPLVEDAWVPSASHHSEDLNDWTADGWEAGSSTNSGKSGKSGGGKGGKSGGGGKGGKSGGAKGGKAGEGSAFSLPASWSASSWSNTPTICPT